MRAAELTFLILTRNEAARISAALQSLPEGAQAYVLDAQSSDETVGLARAAGARCEIRPWTDFLDARRYALSQSRTPWSFMLDADEQLDAELRTALAQCDGTAAGYTITRENYFCGQAIRGGAWAHERILRLVPTAHAHVGGSAGGAIHETLQVQGATGVLNGKLLHDSYPTIASYWGKFERYTAIEAAAIVRPRLAALPALALRSVMRALWQYVGRAGFRDGWRGVFIALASALYPLAVHWKAWRRQ